MVLASFLSPPVLLSLLMSEGPERAGGGLPLAAVPVIIFIVLLLLFLSSYFTSTGIAGKPAVETAVPHDSHDSHHDEPAATRSGAAIQTEVAETAVAVPEKKETAVTVSEPAPSAMTLVEDVPVVPDDLKIVEGIGPKIEGILHAAGIKTFAQLAAAPVSQLEKIVREDAGIRVAFPDTWPEQAKLAANKAWDALEKLQDELKGGRRQ